MNIIKKIIFCIIYICIIFIVSFILGEILVRIIKPTKNFVPTELDQEIGIHNQRGYVGIFDREGFSHFSINSEGWRDIERSIKKPEGVTRIAIVGDSYIEAFQVEREKMVSSQLETMLNSDDSKRTKFEVIPFGMSGFDAAQAYLTMVYKILQYHPDLIIYAFVSGNDIRDGVRELRDFPWKPYFFLKNNKLVLDETYKNFIIPRLNSWKKNTYLFFRKHSKLIEYWKSTANPQIKIFLNSFHKPKISLESRDSKLSVKDEPGLSKIDEIYQEPSENSPYRKGWDITEHLILEMNKFAITHNIRFMVLGVTMDIQVDSRTVLPSKYDLYYPEHRLVDFAKENNIYYLPLAEEFVKLNKEKGIIFHGNNKNSRGHWNENGHYYVATKLYEYLKVRSELLNYINGN